MIDERTIIAGLMARGLSLPVAQGIAANMIAESGLNPGINEIAPLVEGSRGGYGLNQWTGPRRRQFEAYAAQQGRPLDDVNLQLDFTLWELHNSESAAMNALAGVSDPTEAARIYSDKFLRPGIPHMDRRLSEARRLAGMGAPDMAAGNAMAPGGNALAAAVPDANAFAPWRSTRRAIDPASFTSRKGFV